MKNIQMPVFVNLGKTSNKNIKKLEKGRGKLMDEVQEVLERTQYQLGDAAEDKILVPIVVVYKEKPKKIKTALDWFNKQAVLK